MRLTAAASTTTSVEVTTPLRHVREGGMMGIHCQVTNLRVEYMITISRQLTGSDSPETLSYDDNIQPDVDDRVFLAVKRIPNGAVVYFLTIVDVDTSDEGEYFCKVLSTVGTVAEIAADSVTIPIQHFPTDPNPTCYSAKQSLEVVAGTLVVLNCTSDAGYPPVKLTWGKTGDPTPLSSGSNHQQDTVVQDGVVFRELRFKVSANGAGAIFLCSLSSPAFPGQVKTCHVGPFKVLPNPGGDNNQVPSTSTIHQDSSPDEDQRRPTVPSKVPAATDRCKLKCSSMQNTTTQYWIISAVLAVTILLVFLTVTTCLALRLRTMGRDRPPPGPPMVYRYPQLREGVYEALEGIGGKSQGGGGDGGNMQMYMTLDKLHKTGGKLQTGARSGDESTAAYAPTTQQHRTEDQYFDTPMLMVN